jgi:hypothetical protein
MGRAETCFRRFRRHHRFLQCGFRASLDVRAAHRLQGYEKYCKGTTPGGGRIIACLDKQQLSEGCRKVIDATKK